MPTLFISGDIDSFVPTEQTIRLHHACSSPNKELWIVPGGNHNDTWLIAGPAYMEKLKGFFAANRNAAASIAAAPVSSVVEECVETKKDQ